MRITLLQIAQRVRESKTAKTLASDISMIHVYAKRVRTLFLKRIRGHFSSPRNKNFFSDYLLGPTPRCTTLIAIITETLFNRPYFTTFLH